MGISRAKIFFYRLKPQGSKGWQQRDIIPIVNKAFEVSFARVDKVKHAIAERGWGPLNRVLLLHPDIQASKKREEEKQQEEEEQKEEEEETTTGTTSAATVTTINISEGAGSAFMDKLVASQLKNKGRLAKLAEERKRDEERTGLHNKLQDMTKISSGTLAAKGHFSLDVNVRDAIARSVAAKEAKEQNAKSKRDEKDKKAEEKYRRVKAKEATGSYLTLDDLKSLCRWERSEADPTNISTMKAAEIRPLYAEIKLRRSTNLDAAPVLPRPLTLDLDDDSSDEE
jgi:hypothetical protein